MTQGKLSAVAFVMVFLAATLAFAQSLPGLGALPTPREAAESIPYFVKAVPLDKIPGTLFLPKVPRVRDQGSTGTCVGWALAYAKTILVNRDSEANLDSDNVLLSPLFIYLNASKDASCQSGVYVSDAVEGLKTKGAATMGEMPFVHGGKICRPIPISAVNAAQKRKTLNLGKIAYSPSGITSSELDDLKRVLAQGFPIVIVVRVTDALYYSWKNKDDSDVLTEPGKNTLGPSGDRQYHAMLLVGYDNAKGPGGAFKIINSWGSTFGAQGILWLGYGAARQVLTEAYTLLEN